MRPIYTRKHHESFDKWRQGMLDETSRFIEWGLRNPEQVEWIPRHPVGRGAFSERVRTLFWSLILQHENWPE